MKKILTIALATALCVPCVIGLSGCNKNPQKTNVVAKDVYAMSAVTGVSYLQNVQVNSETKLSANFASPVENGGEIQAPLRPNIVNDKDVANLKNCFTMFDGLLAGEVNQSVSKNEIVESGKYNDYKLKMTINLPSEAGIGNFVIYYNETGKTSNEEVKDGETELEESTTLAGVLVQGEKEYEITGARNLETESEDGKIETEASIEFTTKLDANNSVTVTQTVENNEIEYEYEIMKDGETILETELEVEHKNKKTELEFEIVDLTNPTAIIERSYEMEKGKDAQNFVVEVFEKEQLKETINVEVLVDGKYKLTYTSNNFTEII